MKILKNYKRFLNEDAQPQQPDLVINTKEDVIKLLQPLVNTQLNLDGVKDGKPTGCSAIATLNKVTVKYNPAPYKPDYPNYHDFSCNMIFTISDEKQCQDQNINAEFKSILEEIKDTPCSFKGGGQWKYSIIMDGNSSYLASYDIGATKDSSFFAKLAEILKVEIPWYAKETPNKDLYALGAGTNQ